MSRVSPGVAAAYSNDMECPSCHVPLEVSPGSRVLATTLGLAAAYFVWWVTVLGGTRGPLDWVLPVVYSFLTFSVVSAVFLMTTADLITKPEEPVAEPLPEADSHGSGAAHH